jgi:hypothetical protein
MTVTDPAYVLPSYPPVVQAREHLAQRLAAWCRDGASEAAAFAEIEAVVRALTAACANARVVQS